MDVLSTRGARSQDLTPVQAEPGVVYSAELTAPEVWSLILEETRKSINPQTFATWLEPTEAIALTSDELLVQVKSQFAVDYIGGQYGAVLAEISANQFILQRVESLGIERAVGYQGGDRRTKRRGGALEPSAQALPPAFGLYAVVHVALVIAVSANLGK